MFSCEKCGKGYSYKASLDKHVETCKGNIIICKICDIEFKYKYNLNAHNKIFHADLMCEYCHKTFKNKNSIYLHQKQYCIVINKNKEKAIEEKLEKLEKLEQHMIEIKEQLNKQPIIAQTINNINTINNISINNYNPKVSLEDYNENILNECLKLFITFRSRTPMEKYKIINDVAKIMHIDDPINRNIYVSNLHDDFANILHNHKWVKVNKIEFFNEFVSTKGKILYKLLDATDISDSLAKHIKAVIDVIEYNSDNEKDKICQDLVLLFYNNKELVNVL